MVWVASPAWRSDGRELFFLGGAGRMVAAEVTTEPGFQVARLTPLFEVGDPATVRFLVHAGLGVSAVPGSWPGMKISHSSSWSTWTCQLVTSPLQ